MSDFSNFRAVYDELTDEVNRARYQFLPDHLRNWFAQIDDTPHVTGIVQKLQEGLDFDAWYKQAEASVGSFVGSGSLEWPQEREKALGMKLLMFRACAERKLEAAGIGHSFLYVGSNINDNARVVIDQIFNPMARELRRYLELKMSQIPAADRIVSLDHNSPAYQQAMEALATLERILQETNSYGDPEEKERVISEISAARRLLNSAKVRIGAISAVISVPVIFLVKKFADVAIGDAAGAVIQTLEKLLGAIF